MRFPFFSFGQRHDFISVKVFSLPGCFTDKLRVDRTPNGARYQVSHWGPLSIFYSLKGKTGHLTSSQANTLFSELHKLGALHAINRSMPGAMDGYHVAVHLRMHGKTNRFRLSNLSWFQRDELDGYLTDLFKNIGAGTVSSP
jgi:hypothetical protein